MSEKKLVQVQFCDIDHFQIYLIKCLILDFGLGEISVGVQHSKEIEDACCDTCDTCGDACGDTDRQE